MKTMEQLHAQFVDIRSADLIQRVTVVMPIADVMRAKKIIDFETYSEIQAKATKMAKMRVLLEALNSDEAKSAFYNLLKDKEHFLFEELERKGSSLQTADDKRVTEPHNIIRYNPSSIKYRSKIEELQKDPSKKKVSSIYFSKSKNYIIGSGGSGTVYLGLKEDGTEVAIKRIIKDSLKNNNFENELKHLRDVELKTKNIVRYVDLAEDEDFYYLALQLCEYDMEDYMENLRLQEQKDKDNTLRKIVTEMLVGLQDLHHAKVIHRDIKPRNVLIDSEKNARLADFGLSRKLEEGRSTVHTVRAGTQGWEATEILNQSEKSGYKMSSDIQVAGMLVYYILSDGKHPFGEIDREVNIKNGKYSLEHVQDIVAKDLIEGMINKDPAERLTIDEVLRHPFFWDKKRQEEVLRKLGDRHEVQNYISISKTCQIKKTDISLTPREAVERACSKKTVQEEALKKLDDPHEVQNNISISKPCKIMKTDTALTPREDVERACSKKTVKDKVLEMLGETEEVQNKTLENLSKFCDYAENYTKGKTFNKWKSELKDKWPAINIDKHTPEDLIGLLRCFRNKMTHDLKFDEEMLDHFPDFFISLYRLAINMSWDCTWS